MKDVIPMEGYGLGVVSGDGYALEGEGYALEGDGIAIDLNPISI